LALTDWLNFPKNVPLDSLSAGRGSQGTIVGPELLLIDRVEESAKTDLVVSIGILEHFENLVNEQVLTITAQFSIKENTNDTAEGSVIISVDNVHLHIQILAFKCVLRWGMEVELSSDKLGHVAILEGLGETTVIEAHQDSMFRDADTGSGKVFNGDFFTLEETGTAVDLVVPVVFKVNHDFISFSDIPIKVDR
jgi:hypothetical protein